MEHYENLISALGGAMGKCLAWQIVEETTEEERAAERIKSSRDGRFVPDRFYNARDLLGLSLELGGETEDIGDTVRYVVSDEGAIGMDPGYEFLTKWLFIPITDEVLREKVISRMMVELEYDEAIENGMSEAEARAAFSEKYAIVTGQQIENKTDNKAEEKEQKRFCKKCGAKLSSSYKFCKKCGNPL